MIQSLDFVTGDESLVNVEYYVAEKNYKKNFHLFHGINFIFTKTKLCQY